MAKHRATGSAGNEPKGSAAPGRRSGQGASSALREMQRRQLQNPNQEFAPDPRDPQPRPSPHQNKDGCS